MKVIALIGEQANHWGLVERMHSSIKLSSVVSVRKKTTKKSRFLFNAFLKKILATPLSRAWKKMLNEYEVSNNFRTSICALTIDDINEEKVIEFIRREKPDLVVVSGTNLLKKDLINAISESANIMNLHTGLSPYIKGGPNCTNWCLSLGRFGYIGNTIMWLDEGIDSGNLIGTQVCSFTGNESLTEIHKMVMESAHDLFIDVVQKYKSGTHLPNVKQDSIGRGELFLTKDWGCYEIIRAYFNFIFKFSFVNRVNKRSKAKIVDYKESKIES